MGIVNRLVIGRWLVRWLLRGSPAAVAAKLAAVGLFGAWKWHRERRREESARATREISADYEVLGADRLTSPEPGGSSRGTAKADESNHPSGHA